MAYRQTYCFVEFVYESVAFLSTFSLVRFPVELYREKRFCRGAIAYEEIDMTRFDPSARAIPAGSMSRFDEVIDANFGEIYSCIKYSSNFFNTLSTVNNSFGEQPTMWSIYLSFFNSVKMFAL